MPRTLRPDGSGVAHAAATHPGHDMAGVDAGGRLAVRQPLL